MDVGQIEWFLRELGCDKIRVRAGTVDSTCPLALYVHSKRTDNTPSFGVSISPGSTSGYKCYSCGNRGTLPSLLWKLNNHGKRNLNHLFTFLGEHNAPSPDEVKATLERLAAKAETPYWHDKHAVVAPLAAKPVEPEKFLEESALKGLADIPPGIIDYLTGPRRLTKETILEWELGWHKGARRISIPIRDEKGRLVGLSGRASPLPEHEGMKPKYLHASGFRTALHLYGEHKAKPSGRVLLCEGFFDVIYLSQMGYQAVAMCGSFLSEIQAEKLTKFASVTIVPDGDGPGRDSAVRSQEILSKRTPTTVIEMLDGKDPDELSEDELISLLGPPNL